jgi:membrane protein
VPFVLLLLVGLTHLVQYLAEGPTATADPLYLFHRFLPPHGSGEGDRFAVVERILAGITERRGELSLYAAPAFIWFSTRLFAGIRTSLNDVFDVSARPSTRRWNFVVVFLAAKARDAMMVVLTLSLFLANTVLSAALAILEARGSRLAPEFGFLVTTAGRLSGELLAFAFAISLFFVTYKYASLRRLPWRTALLASVFTAVAFEIAKRLFGVYLANFADADGLGGDATVGALVLFVLWVYYTAIVFLLGAVVAETWELRKMLRMQRAVLR